MRAATLKHPVRALVLALSAGAAAAAPPVLDLPVACEIGRDCFVQNFFDHDPGPGRRDYACGRLSYDGHDGTDFRTRDVPDMHEGVAVVAAAPGTVRAVRDGMPDISVAETGPEAVRGREAGNGVVLDHGEGWETQYSHLRQGSVAVAPGQRVAAGERLGLIGMSGAAEFPHVEFSVRKDGRDLDPFVGVLPAWACHDPRAPLWSAAASDALHYQPTGLLVSGFADRAPTAEGAREGAFRLGESAADPVALVLWVDLFGTLAGDMEQFRITAPDGRVILERTAPLADNNVSWFSFSGVRRPEGGWQPGRYTGRYALMRDGRALVDHQQVIDIRN